MQTHTSLASADLSKKICLLKQLLPFLYPNNDCPENFEIVLRRCGIDPDIFLKGYNGVNHTERKIMYGIGETMVMNLNRLKNNDYGEGCGSEKKRIRCSITLQQEEQVSNKRHCLQKDCN